MYISDIIHPCHYESVPENLFGPLRNCPRAMRDKFNLFVHQLLFYGVSLLIVNLLLWLARGLRLVIVLQLFNCCL